MTVTGGPPAGRSRRRPGHRDGPIRSRTRWTGPGPGSFKLQVFRNREQSSESADSAPGPKLRRQAGTEAAIPITSGGTGPATLPFRLGLPALGAELEQNSPAKLGSRLLPVRVKLGGGRGQKGGPGRDNGPAGPAILQGVGRSRTSGSAAGGASPSARPRAAPASP